MTVTLSIQEVALCILFILLIVLIVFLIVFIANLNGRVTQLRSVIDNVSNITAVADARTQELDETITEVNDIVKNVAYSVRDNQGLITTGASVFRVASKVAGILGIKRR